MIQPSPQPGSVALFKIEGARIVDPVMFAPASTITVAAEGTDSFGRAAEWKIKTPHSMEARATEALAAAARARALAIKLRHFARAQRRAAATRSHRDGTRLLDQSRQAGRNQT